MRSRANDGDPAQVRNLSSFNSLQTCRIQKQTAALWIAAQGAGAAGKDGFEAVERGSFRDNRRDIAARVNREVVYT